MQKKNQNVIIFTKNNNIDIEMINRYTLGFKDLRLIDFNGDMQQKLPKFKKEYLSNELLTNQHYINQTFLFIFEFIEKNILLNLDKRFINACDFSEFFSDLLEVVNTKQKSGTEYSLNNFANDIESLEKHPEFTTIFSSINKNWKKYYKGNFNNFFVSEFLKKQDDIEYFFHDVEEGEPIFQQKGNSFTIINLSDSDDLNVFLTNIITKLALRPLGVPIEGSKETIISRPSKNLTRSLIIFNDNIDFSYQKSLNFLPIIFAQSRALGCSIVLATSKNIHNSSVTKSIAANTYNYFILPSYLKHDINPVKKITTFFDEYHVHTKIADPQENHYLYFNNGYNAEQKKPHKILF